MAFKRSAVRFRLAPPRSLGFGRLAFFCGFVRRPHRGPTAYPVACSPQAWAAAAPFGLLAACLGLELGCAEDEVRFRDPAMPNLLEEIVIRDLRLGKSSPDLRLHRYGRDVTVNVMARHGP